ncbi:MAG TPA: protein kinase [Candidatus Sulfotelmatobacter sp.]|nr:protein kinase [Candidatus Sulfotelmatobacter sp.]
MALTSGTKLGPYEIQSTLGAGGMGEVYRARDTRLDRTVAIKVLLSHLSSDPELKQRMEREAKAISALQHANICTLHDIGTQDGTDFLVMEYLEGQTLADRLTKGALPVDQVLKIGTEVAQALEKAHQNGIIHRDLKPANIMLTKAGAKLMDFGLAKPSVSIAPQAIGPFTPSTPTVNLASLTSAASPLTQKGSIVGTFQYIAPEVLQGAEADARSDLFSFGCVLYEMITGRRAFEGKSQLSVFTAILEKDPDPVTATQPLAPAMLAHVVSACLAKDPADRIQSAHDVTMDLRWISSSSAPAVLESPPAPRRVTWFAAVAAAIVLGTLAGFFMHRPAASAPSTRTVINPPPGAHFRLTDDAAGPPVLSPDGAYLAFTATGADGKTSIWVRPMNEAEAHVLPDTNDAIFPFWSPDSRSIGFFANNKLKTIEIEGGVAQVVCDVPLGRGAAWGSGGVIVFSASPVSALSQVSASGGVPTSLTKLDASQHTSHRWPFILPDGRHFLYFAMHHDPSKSSNNAIYYASLDGRENRLLLRAQTNAIYAAGFLLFGRGDQLVAQPFDPANGKLSGQLQTVSTGVLNDVTTWHLGATASNGGVLAFGNGTSGNVQLVWMDRTGRQTGVAAENLQNLQYARLSPKGDRIALMLDSGINDIWCLDLARGVRTRLTFGPVANTFPVWSPDGKWIAYGSTRPGSGGIFRKLADGSGAEETLISTPDPTGFIPTDWSSDGKTLFYSTGLSTGDQIIWALPLDGERKPQQVVAHGTNGALSPNGRWLAYTAFSGPAEVYVVGYGGSQGKWQVSPNGGQVPQWSKDGKELYYFDGSQSISAVPVKDLGNTLEFGAAQTLVSQWTILTLPFYSVTPDGKKLLMERVSQQVSQPVTIITNFTAGLKK